jgi:hypothetical protein
MLVAALLAAMDPNQQATFLAAGDHERTEQQERNQDEGDKDEEGGEGGEGGDEGASDVVDNAAPAAATFTTFSRVVIALVGWCTTLLLISSISRL